MRCLVLAAAAALLPGTAAAEDCLQQVERFAEELGLQADLPQAPAGEGAPAPSAPSRQPGTEDLAESGGVMAPPETGAAMPTFEPPPDAGANMPTAPDVDGDRGSLDEQAAKDAQVQALLVAARQAALSGDNQRCLDRLQEAVALASDSAG